MHDTLLPPPPHPPPPPPPPPPPRSSRPSPPPPPPTGRPAPIEPNGTHRSAAAWLAVVGSGLLFIAAVVVVASRWQQIPQSIRFSGLVAAFVLVAAIAEHVRRSAPTTATVIAHLVPGLAVTVGIAAGSTFHQPWPVCLMIGGSLGVVITEVQRKRWSSPRMGVISALALVLGLCGLAVELGVPAPILVGVAACLVLLGRRELEGATMAALVGASPVLATMTTVKIGDGTMLRIGLAGEAVAWSAPIAGLVAAAVLGVIAHRRHSTAFAGTALAAVSLNVVAGIAVGATPPSMWMCLLPVAIIAVELATASRLRSIWTELSVRASNALASLAVAVGWVVPPVVVIAWCFGGTPSLPQWALPLTLSFVAMAVIGLGRLSDEPSLADAAFAGAVGFAVITAASLGATSLTISLVSLACIVLFAAAPRLRGCLGTTQVGAAYLSISIVQRAVERAYLVGAHAPWTVRAGIDVALVVVGGTLTAWVVLRCRPTLVARTMIVIGSTAMLAAIAAPQWRITIATIVAAGIGSMCMRRRPALAVPVATMTTAIALLQIGAPSWGAVMAFVLAAFVAAQASTPRWLRLGASVQLVVAGWLAAQAFGASPNGLVGLMLVGAVTMTGVAFLTPRFTMLDSAALAATALAVLSAMAVGIHPAAISLTVLVGSAQGVVYGIAQRRLAVAAVSAVVGAGALGSLWFTSGMNASVLASLARFDFTGVDLSVFVLGVAMLAIGVASRRWQQLSTWLAYGPGLALLSSWTIAVEAGRGADWATMAGLMIGIAAMAIGGWKRMAAPLVIGTGLLATTVAVATGSQLASLPGWTWLVVGGVVLLGLAAVIERHGKNDGDARSELATMFARFH